MEKIQNLLGPGVSLASIASWADDYRDDDPGTYNWHFVDIPIIQDTYDPEKECARTPKGDCVVNELDRLRNDVRCKRGDEQQRALKFAVHFVGDIHQPLHTVADKQGGNQVDVVVFMHGARCKSDCRMTRSHNNLHAVWDSVLIQMTTWDWGAYVTRLENGWLKNPEGQKQSIDAINVVQWAKDTHQVAQQVWKLSFAKDVLDEPYYETVLPLLDQQLGLAALRLAAFLKDAFSSDQCPVP